MNLFEDTYRTIEESSEAVFRDRGSKFIAYAYPLKNKESIKEILADRASVHPKANHFCWAYRLGHDGSDYRVNDDGEPSGTAGRPRLNVLLSHRVTQVFVVVVRYFGGTLLGVPGLIHAYKTATDEAIKSGLILERTVMEVYSIRFDYMHMNDVMSIVKQSELEVLKQDFELSCSILLAIRKNHLDEVLRKLSSVEGAETRYCYTI